MKALLSFAILIALFFTNSFATAQDEKYEATSVIEIKSFSEDEADKIQRLCDKSLDISVDYSCADAGILVIKLYNSAFSDPADARVYIGNKINEVIPAKRQKFLHTSTRLLTGVSKC